METSVCLFKTAAFDFQAPKMGAVHLSKVVENRKNFRCHITDNGNKRLPGQKFYVYSSTPMKNLEIPHA